MAEGYNKQADNHSEMPESLGLTEVSTPITNSLQPANQPTSATRTSIQHLPQTSTALSLFVYRKELACKKRRSVRLARAKLRLSEGLVSNNRAKAKNCNKEELTCLTRGVVYKNKLKRNLARFDMWMEMKMKNAMAERLKENCKVVNKSDIK